MLKDMIHHIWYGTHNIMTSLRCSKRCGTDIEYFNCHLEFVDYLDIPDWDNWESIYIPMNFNGEIITR